MHLSAEAEKEQVIRLIRKLGFVHLPSSRLFYLESTSFTITLDEDDVTSYKSIIDFLGTYSFRVLKSRDQRMELMRLQQEVFTAKINATKKFIKVVT